ncbi:hypothetical protein LJC19_02875 [Oxalobacter sp. OttesenSCG-928-P03]|nr:hypothetical protein [Oxalobacter sp. OttesenSCG-928-P03]
MALTFLLVVSGQAGAFSLSCRMIVAAVSLISVFLFVFLHFRSKKSFWIDISGSGEIRLREDSRNVSTPVFPEKQTLPDTDEYYMVNGSTVWPSLLFLRLESASKQKRYFPVFSDSLKEEEFKALYIACQWLTVHQK